MADEAPEGAVEVWRDEHGVEWELADFSEGGAGCVVRERNILDLIDGDAREGYAVIGRFGDAEEARDFLRREGFDPVGVFDA
ncbi:MAG TPA: hypothetical protein VFT46_10995 [Holophagaceae bacterium]|nr:hypothetical protein [Holophagaceae bacterium]